MPTVIVPTKKRPNAARTVSVRKKSAAPSFSTFDRVPWYQSDPSDATQPILANFFQPLMIFFLELWV